MSIWNALSIGAAGVGRGYRAGQALEREMAEMKRKALLEEREAQLRERSQTTQDALAQSTIGYQGVQSDIGRETLAGAREGRSRRSQPAFPSGSKARFLEQDFNLPNTMGGVEDISAFLGDVGREGGRREEFNYRRTDPWMFGSKKPYLTAEEEAQVDITERIIQSQPKPDPFSAGSERGDKALAAYNARQNEILRTLLPKRLRALMFPDSSGAGRDSSRAGFAPPRVKP
jgi:hypothetical protein